MQVGGVIEFASAVKKFAQKIGRTQPKVRPLRFGRNDVHQRIQNNISRIKNLKGQRRTTSFAGIKITEDSDEERDSDKEGEGFKPY